MEVCSTCDGFVPPRAVACPHCDAATGVTSRRTTLRRVLEAAGGGAIAFTLMACYGAPPRNWDGPQTPAGTNDCTTAGDDLDHDGWCEADCDEVNPDIFPGAADAPGDGLDQNCDGADGEAAATPDAPAGDTQTIAE